MLIHKEGCCGSCCLALHFSWAPGLMAALQSGWAVLQAVFFLLLENTSRDSTSLQPTRKLPFLDRVRWCLEAQGSGAIHWASDHLPRETENQRPAYTALALFCFPGCECSFSPLPEAMRRDGDVSPRSLKPQSGTEKIYNDTKLLKPRKLLRGAILFIPSVATLRTSCSRIPRCTAIQPEAWLGKRSSSLVVLRIMDKKCHYKSSHNHFGMLSIFSWFNLLS